MKNNVSAQDVCDLLNEILRLDYDCIHNLINHREECNENIANHPDIIVTNESTLGIMGLINGLFGIREDGMGAICYEYDGDEITGFKLTLTKENLLLYKYYVSICTNQSQTDEMIIHNRELVMSAVKELDPNAIIELDSDEIGTKKPDSFILKTDFSVESIGNIEGVFKVQEVETNE